MKLYEVYTRRYVLESERLLFRVITEADCDDMFAYSCDPEVSRYLLWSPHPSKTFTKRQISAIAEAYREERFFDFALIEKESGRMIGTCGFTSVDRASQVAEIGYVLSRDCWGKGLGSEAVRTVLSFAFLSLPFHRVEARFMEENIASRRLAESVGMTVEGFFRDKLFVKGRYRTIGVASILKDEFTARYPHARSPLRRAEKDDFPNETRKRFRFFADES